MKNNKIYIVILPILIMIIILLLFYIKNDKKYDYSNISLEYKESNKIEKKLISLNEDKKQKIINFLKKEKFIKMEPCKCILKDTYTITFDNYKLYFDENESFVNLYNKKTKETIYTSISKEFRQYIYGIIDNE